MAACGFQIVLYLHFAHEVDVAVEEFAHQLLQLAVLAKTQPV